MVEICSKLIIYHVFISKKVIYHFFLKKTQIVICQLAKALLKWF
jgi:hypothetical protein